MVGAVSFCLAPTTLSFRDAPLGAGPESITTIVSMDSGLAACASPRNDGGESGSSLREATLQRNPNPWGGKAKRAHRSSDGVEMVGTLRFAHPTVSLRMTGCISVMRKLPVV